jgi:hypothetical protein
MTTTLTKYEAAKHALAEARSVDEVKDIRDRSIAMKLYAKQAKNKQLEADAAEIRLRAERRLGEMMKEQPKASGGEHGGRKPKDGIRKNPSNAKATLSEAGIDKNLANRSRKAAAMSEEKFERQIQEGREAIITPEKLKVVSEKSKPKKVVVQVGSLVDQCVDKVRAAINDALQQMRRGHAEQRKFEHLFSAVHDLIDDLESRTMTPPSVEQSAEERRAVNG